MDEPIVSPVVPAPPASTPQVSIAPAPTSTANPSTTPLPSATSNGPISSSGATIAATGSGPGPTSNPHSNDAIDLRAASLYLNRELSWLEFNARVLAEADNDAVPLFERLKFHAIVATNLDEFFMVRVAGLKQQATGEVGDLPPDGMTPIEALAGISARAHELFAQQMTSLHTSILPKLTEAGVLLMKPEALSPEQLAQLDAQFH
ncbi:MAG: RNA degradosome polyphosphate kinase, partial [Polyangiaceae bacterium]